MNLAQRHLQKQEFGVKVGPREACKMGLKTFKAAFFHLPLWRVERTFPKGPLFITP